jgi:hypothetical protein
MSSRLLHQAVGKNLPTFQMCMLPPSTGQEPWRLEVISWHFSEASENKKEKLHIMSNFLAEI